MMVQLGVQRLRCQVNPAVTVVFSFIFFGLAQEVT